MTKDMDEQIPLIVDRRGPILNLALNNPAKKNALTSEMMGAMVAAIEGAKEYEEIRAIVISGEGSGFCSGADVKTWKPEQLQLLLKTITDCSIPTIADVHGICLGGGMGLICACDFVVCKEDTVFGFPEIRIGMIPAVIFPYVSRKLDTSKIRELFITGDRFSTQVASSLGLIYYNNDLEQLLKSISEGAPKAQKYVKSMIDGNVLLKSNSDRDEELASLISDIRQGEECQEGIVSFLEKRKPNWVK